MNFERINEILSELCVLPFYPSDPAARIAIARMVGNMAHNEHQVRWLVSVMTSGAFEKWEGPRELRAVFCMKFSPRDGGEAISSVYPDGLTAQQLNPGKKLELEAPAAPLQISGDCDPVSDDPEMQELARRVKEAQVTHLPAANVETSIRPGEGELAALMRSVEGWNTAHERRRAYVRPVTDAEIAAVLEEQNRNRKESAPAALEAE